MTKKKMIDTHAHLDFPEFDEDREEVIARFFENARLESHDASQARRGGKAIVNIGVDLKTSKKSIELAEKHENIFASVGLHPDFFSKPPFSFQGSTFLPPTSRRGSSRSNLFEKDFEELKNIANNKKVVAIGECGLDYFSHTADPITIEQKENQKKGFIAQINLAQELGLPVIVHCRNSADMADGTETKSAWEDVYKIVYTFLRLNLKNKKSNISRSPAFPFPDCSSGNSSKPDFTEIHQGRKLTKFVLHCYSGEKKDTEKFLKLPNVYFSFSGNITYPKPIERAEKLAEAVRMVPLERIMLDSDCPFLAPQQARGKRNDPSYIRYIAEKIAEIKGISLEKVEKTTDENANNFFGFS